MVSCKSDQEYCYQYAGDHEEISNVSLDSDEKSRNDKESCNLPPSNEEESCDAVAG